MPTLKTVTLGCKVNQYETEYLRQGLARLGYRDANEGEPADLCVVNTCTVTADGEAKSRKMIRQLGRRYPQAEIIVMGCYATRAEQEVAAMPGVVEVLTDKRQLPELLGRLGLLDVPTGISTFGSRHRAYVKVQDGCRMQCSYCIIPQVRPVLSSRRVPDVLDEIRRLVDNGHREIVLTGIHLGHYGMDLSDRPDLTGLLRRIVELDGAFRVRLSSIEAVEVTDDLIALMAQRTDRICPHLHISMQSGSDAVLQRMRRRQSVDQFLKCCAKVRDALDCPALTTDVIVGFPGETDENFAETCRTVREVGFSKLHVFRFSPRQGTPAADFPEQIPEVVKQRRAVELGGLGKELRQQFFERLIGRSLQVLVEAPIADQPGLFVGTSGRYVPIELPSGEDQVGRLVRASAATLSNGRIRAVIDGSVDKADV